MLLSLVFTIKNMKEHSSFEKIYDEQNGKILTPLNQSEIEAIIQDAENLPDFDSLLELKPRKIRLSQEQVYSLTNEIWDLGQRCKQCLEQEIIPSIKGGQEELQKMIDAEREMDVIPKGEAAVYMIKKIPDEEQYKLGGYFYQIALHHALFLSLDKLITPSNCAYNAYQKLKECHEARYVKINALVEHNLRLVASCAKRHPNSVLEPCDLINEGGIALMRAIDRYDPNKGVTLSTWAVPPIHWSMSSAVQRFKRVIRTPGPVIEMRSDIAQAESVLMQRFQRKPTRAEIAAELGISVKQVEDALLQTSDVVSIDAPMPGRDGEEVAKTGHDLISDPRSSKDMAAVCNKESLKGAFERLTERERLIIYSRYFQGMTLEETGKNLTPQLTRERIRLLEERAIVKLRKFLES